MQAGRRSQAPHPNQLTWTMEKGNAKISSSMAATVMPFQRLNTPARMVKIVWLQHGM